MKKQSNLLRLFKDYRRYWPGLIYLLFLMLLSGVFKALAAYFFGKAIDFGTLGLFTPVIHFILLTGTMYLLDAARLALFNIETARVIERMFLEIKRRAFHAVASSRLAEYEQTPAATRAVPRRAALHPAALLNMSKPCEAATF